MSRVRLTMHEIEMLLAAAGNIDPQMFADGTDDKKADRDQAAWESGLSKLRDMLAQREATSAHRKK